MKKGVRRDTLSFYKYLYSKSLFFDYFFVNRRVRDFSFLHFSQKNKNNLLLSAVFSLLFAKFVVNTNNIL